MGQLKQNEILPHWRRAGVCLDTGSATVSLQKFAFFLGESLSQRANRLDLELKSPRADAGARGEPEHIEISGTKLCRGRE